MNYNRIKVILNPWRKHIRNNKCETALPCLSPRPCFAPPCFLMYSVHPPINYIKDPEGMEKICDKMSPSQFIEGLIAEEIFVCEKKVPTQFLKKFSDLETQIPYNAVLPYNVI